MQRAIIGFGRDAAGDWVALLACGHRQHVRHEPPRVHREWVLTPAGRRDRLGRRIDCRLCEPRAGSSERTAVDR
jgi:hypothetical protein